jgi:RecA/RadA recombinase
MPKKITKSDTEQIKERSRSKPEEIEVTPSKGDFGAVISTGSTLLDLAISGGRVRGGGVPRGILMEIFGPSGVGKTSILAEMCADAQAKGGSVKFLDPEARLDQEYMRIYGMELAKEDYHLPSVVNEVFDHILNWNPSEPPENAANIIATDSLAALSSDLEMSDKGDKRGQKIAKDFSSGLRKTCRLIKKNGFIIACSNQVRQGDTGEVTSGGKGIPFYASLRIRVGPPAQNKYLIKEKTIHGVKHEKTYGIQSICTIKKSSIDDPYREANIFIVFGLGIDDVRGNLAYLKQMTGNTKYDGVTEEFARIDTAIAHIENNNLELELKNKVIDLWEEIENTFRTDRKPKERGKLYVDQSKSEVRDLQNDSGSSVRTVESGDGD